jgi:hypothetical protein
MIPHRDFDNESEFRKEEAMRIIYNVFMIVGLLLNFMRFLIFAGLASVSYIVFFGPRWKFFVVSCLLIFPLHFILLQFLAPGTPFIVVFYPKSVLINLLSATVVTNLHNPDDQAYLKERGEFNDFFRHYFQDFKDALLVLFSRIS